MSKKMTCIKFDEQFFEENRISYRSCYNLSEVIRWRGVGNKMQFNLIRTKWKQYLKIFLLIVIMIFIINLLLDQRKQIDELESIVSSSERKLAFYYNSFPIEYAFEVVQEEPTKENLKLLFNVLINQQRKIETLIQLNKHNIDKVTWNEYLNKPNTQAIMYVNHLSHNANEMDKNDWAKLNEMKKLWEEFEDATDTLISGSGEIIYPAWLTLKYIELINSLDEIKGIESWLTNFMEEKP